tara:strand:+ start:712 stop:1371 length:660 start_codon:yes stop_codon:yes gene_type:complete
VSQSHRSTECIKVIGINYLLALHTIGGTIALLSAAVAVVTKKGGKQHRYFGNYYTAGMLCIFVTAIPLALLTNNLFLFLIALFSFYLVFSGFRFARNKSGVPHVQDWIAVTTILLSGVGMTALSFIFLRQGNAQWVTLIVFSLIGYGLGITDFKTLKNHNATGKQRISRHLTNMLAGTIATVTAALVTNVTTEPIWVAWLTPTVVITPVIYYWNNRTLS